MFKLLGLLLALIFALVLGSAGPALPGMVELKVKKADSEISTPDENSIRKPKSTQQCAKDFHGRLGDIRTSHLPILDEAYAEAKSINSSMPGKMIFKTRRPPRRTLEGKLVRRAITNASVRGRRGVLSNDGLNWLTRQIVANLKTYLGQPYKPYICTGSEAFLKFVSPHIVKIADIGSAQTKPWKEYEGFVNRELMTAWRALSPVSLPIWATERPTPTLPDSIGPIRPTINAQPTLNVKTTLTSSTTKPDQADYDLPLLKDTDFGIQVNDSSDIRMVIKRLLDRATNNGYLTPKPNNGPPNSKDTIQSTDSLPEAIVALQEAREVLNSNTFTPITRSQINPLIVAFSKLEIFFYLFPDENDRMVKLATAMQNTLDAIKAASLQSCTCSK